MAKMETIADYKEKYRQLNSMLEREQFLLETREKYKNFASPAMKRFLNVRIKEFNEEVARTNYYASISFRELRRIFDSFTDVWEMRRFILDIKGIYGDSKNYELRKLLNRCIRKHNAMLEELGINLEDSLSEDGYIHAEYPQDSEYGEQADQMEYVEEPEAYIEKFPEFVANTNQNEPVFTQNVVEAARADYAEQVAKAIQQAQSGNPGDMGRDPAQPVGLVRNKFQ